MLDMWSLLSNAISHSIEVMDLTINIILELDNCIQECITSGT